MVASTIKMATTLYEGEIGFDAISGSERSCDSLADLDKGASHIGQRVLCHTLL